MYLPVDCSSLHHPLMLGTVATMGGGTISKKANKIVDEFFAAAEEALA